MSKNLKVGDRVMIRQDREFCEEFSGCLGSVAAFDGEDWVLVTLEGPYEYPHLMLHADELMSEDEFRVMQLEDEASGRLTCPDDRF